VARKDIIMLSQKEWKKLHVIRKVMEGVLKQMEAAEILSLSDRQIRRLINRTKLEGEAGMAHKLRGKPSGRKLPKNIKEAVIRLYREKYNDFGPTLASEKIEDIDGIRVNDETLRLWLIESGDWKKVRKGRQHRQWRERKHYYGEMIQIDGSHHDWFEGRGPKCVLMGYIDDATGKVFGRFYEYEGTMPAMDSFKRYARKYGIPVRAYVDRHTTYKSPAKLSVKEAIEGTEPMSEFERAMKEMGVEVIHALSPQAKGRIERLFRTFQDRVVKEMRLKGINTIEQANRFLEGYLPVYNRKFSVKAKKEEDLHRKIPRGMKLDSILCIKTERVLRNDFTISHNGRLYQILDKTTADNVQVQERINGTMVITHDNKCLRFKEITERPERQPKKPIIFIIRKKTGHAPSSDHPWRKYRPRIQNNNYQQTKSSLTQT
jgi:hypothetical protein